MESADISITLFDTQQWKVMTSSLSIVVCQTMESDDVSMPLFDAQQWKVLTSACHCLTHNNGNVNHSPYRHVNHSLCGECPYILG